MEQFRVQSRCECQAALSALLDERHFVLEGTAYRAGQREQAPAHSIDSQSPSDRFDIGWLCPFCGRNTMRTFYAGALRPIRTPVSVGTPDTPATGIDPP